MRADRPNGPSPARPVLAADLIPTVWMELSDTRSGYGARRGTTANGAGKTRPEPAKSDSTDRLPDQALISSMNSERVLWFDLNPPLIADVTIDEPCFWTPRIIMQKWLPSITTATP